MIVLASYTPILKTKRGESKALQHLPSSVKENIIPFFDVLALKAETRNGSDVQEHMRKQANNIVNAWKGSGQCYVDLFDVTPSARCLDGMHPATAIHNELSKNFIEAIPVVGLERDVAYKLAIRELISAGLNTVAIRLESEDLQLPSTLVSRISNLVNELGATRAFVDIFIDHRSILHASEEDVHNLTLKAVNELRKLAVRRLVFSASSMVPNMAGFKQNSVNRVKRKDLLAWKRIARLHKDVAYGDYGVVHPDYSDFDPRLIKPSAKIRYAAENEWIVVKGVRWVTDTTQHHHLSKSLAAQPDFRDADCWGEAYIESSAEGRDKYGTLETWVTVDQNTHICQTVNQVIKVKSKVAAALDA